MEYRVIEFTHEKVQQLGVFESAYDAVDYIIAQAHLDQASALRMYVADGEDTRIFSPTDLVQISTTASAA